MSQHGIEKNASDVTKVDRLGTGNINKLMLEFAIPAIAGVVVNALYNVIDSIFLGRGVGEVGLTATTVAVPMMTILIALGVLVGNGGNALAAIRLGEGKREDAERILGNAFTLLIIAGIIVALIGVFLMEPILTISGATAKSMPYAKSFMTIICAGFIFQGIGMGLNNFIRTAGEPKRALYTMLAGTAVCIVLNYFFVLKFGWGVEGSAFATIIGQAVSAAMVLWYFLGKRAPFRLRAKNLVPEWELSLKICALGTASFALQAAAAVVSIILNSMLFTYGAQSIIGSDGALAALGVVIKLAMFTIFPVLGVAMAAQPIFGYNYGACNYPRVREAFKIAVIWATCIMVFFWSLVHLIPGVLIGIFGVESHLMDFATQALRIYLFALPIVGFQLIGSNYFQATGQAPKSIVLSLTRQVLFLIPLLIVLPQILPSIFPSVTSLDAICYAAPISDLLATVVTAWFVIGEFRRLFRLEAEQKALGK